MKRKKQDAEYCYGIPSILLLSQAFLRSLNVLLKSVDKKFKLW